MRKKVGFLSLAAVLAAGMLLTGCGSSDKGMYATESAMEAPAAEGAFYDMKAMDSFDEDAMEDSADNNTTVVDTSRKLITTLNISAETEELDSTLNIVENRVKELGGYIESSDVYNGSSYSGRTSNRNASLTLRIPAAKLDEFVDTALDKTNITSKSRNVEDVTLSYVDTESRKKALKTEEERLLKILEQAETVEDLITVESRLSEVRYELESTEAKLRTFDNKVNYSTVYLDVREVTKYTPIEEKGALARMGEGFIDSLHSVADGFVELLVWIVVHIPQIVIVVIVVVVFVIVLKKLILKSARKPMTNTPEERKDGQ